jgi:cytochrome c oxidase subunit 3
VHLIHLAGGVISLLIIIYNHFKKKYNSSQTLELNLVQCTGTFLTYYGFLFYISLNKKNVNLGTFNE